MAKAIKPAPQPAFERKKIEEQIDKIVRTPEPNWKELSIELANLLDDVFMFMYPRTLDESKEIHPAQKEFLQKKASQLSKHFFRSKTSGLMISRWDNEQSERIWRRITEELSFNKQGTTK